MLKKSILIICFLSVLGATALAGDNPPTWLRQAASIQPGSYDKEVTAVVLFNEMRVEVTSEAQMLSTENHAVRILTREGRREAVAMALYLVSSGRVKEIEAWLMRPDGSVKYYDKKYVVDIVAGDDVYNEYRRKIISASDDADAGSVFGYTVVSEERPLYFQEKWFSHDGLPTMLSRYSLSLPSGWKANGVTFNHPQITPQVSGSTYTWELRNLPYIKDEPMSPSVVNIVPWVAINYGPEVKPTDKSFGNWMDVTRWVTTLYEPQVVINDAIAAKARELTAGAQTEFEKIRAISGFVQNLQYISIDIGVGSGNGYRPRPSNLVFDRGYGDCKDKANLMRAMLKTLKIEAYPIAIFSGDPTFVREEWASPAQFNHCIIAVRVSDSTHAPTILNHEKLGRLLIFDATDPDTLLGDLPESLQGSYGLIIAGENGGLARMPITPSESNLLDRRIEVKLTADGTISGTIRERSTGQHSSNERGILRVLSASDYSKMLERWLTRGATGAKLVKYTPLDKKEEQLFDLQVEFSAPQYGQTMQKLLVFKPTIVDRRNFLSLTEPTRKHPVIIDSGAISETIVFTLPTGFVVDETPENVNLETPFGTYSTTFEVAADKLTFKRVLKLNRTTVPAEKYGSVRDFFAKMREAEQSPVVLMRK